MDNVAILMDSGCDLPEEVIKKYNIYVLRLKLTYGDTLLEDGIGLSPEEVYSRFPAEIPKTSMPNEYDVSELVNEIRKAGYRKIIAITISSALSGTYFLVKRTLDTMHDIKSFAYDTRNISIGSGFYALWVARMLAAGKTYEEIVERLEKKQNDSKVHFYMDTLEYLQKGGRIGKVVGTLGTLLNLKPIITCNDDGVYVTEAMIRGKKAGIKKLLDTVDEKTPREGREHYWVALLRGGENSEAASCRERLKAEFYEEAIIIQKQIITTMAVHTGPGLVGIGVFNPAF